MKILAVDSSSASASVAVLEDEKIIAESFLNSGLTHSQTLLPMIESTLKKSGLKLEETELFAVTTGPGSFTGLRIGISAIKGIAAVFDRPCAGVSSLYATALNFRETGGNFCVCTDFRNGQIYRAFFEIIGKKIKAIKPVCASSCGDLAEEIKSFANGFSDRSNIYMVGNAAKKCYDSDAKGFSGVRLLDENLNHIKASNVGLAGLELYKNQKCTSALELNPEYFRVSQAERMLGEG